MDMMRQMSVRGLKGLDEIWYAVQGALYRMDVDALDWPYP